MSMGVALTGTVNITVIVITVYITGIVILLSLKNKISLLNALSFPVSYEAMSVSL